MYNLKMISYLKKKKKQAQKKTEMKGTPRL